MGQGGEGPAKAGGWKLQGVRRSGALPLAVLVLGAAVQAQPAAPDAGQLQRRSQENLQSPPAATPPRAGASPAPVDRSGPQLTVRRFVIEGATLIPAQELAAQLAPWLDRPASLGELRAAAERLAGLYRQRGWFARVQIPPQDATDGSLTVRVIEGRFGRLRSETAPGTRADVAGIERLVGGRLQAGEPYSQDALERGLLLANDLPGVVVDGVLQAGQARGTSDLALRIADRPLFSGLASLNNGGSRFTGEAQASAQLALDNPSGRGDQVALSLLAAERLRYGGLGYSLALGSDGLRARVGYTALEYTLGKGFEALDARGGSRSATAGLSYPLLRSGSRSAWLGLDLTSARYEDKTLGVVQRERQVRSAALFAWGQGTDGWGGGGSTDWRVGFIPGHVDIDAGAASDAAGPRTAGSFRRIHFDLRRDQRVGDGVFLRARLAGQWAGGNLDSSQKFGLGGPWGVRGYPGDDAQGDSGALLQVELHRYLGQGFDLFAFADGGRIRQHQDTWPGWDTRATGNNSYSLASAGAGLQWTHPGGAQASIVIAEPLGNNPGSGVADRNQDGSETGTRAWLFISFRF